MSSSCIANVSAEAMSDLTKSARHEYVKLGSGTYHVTSKLRKSTACDVEEQHRKGKRIVRKERSEGVWPTNEDAEKYDEL